MKTEYQRKPKRSKIAERPTDLDWVEEPLREIVADVERDHRLPDGCEVVMVVWWNGTRSLRVRLPDGERMWTAVVLEKMMMDTGGFTIAQEPRLRISDGTGYGGGQRRFGWGRLTDKATAFVHERLVSTIRETRAKLEAEKATESVASVFRNWKIDSKYRRETAEVIEATQRAVERLRNAGEAVPHSMLLYNIDTKGSVDSFVFTLRGRPSAMLDPQLDPQALLGRQPLLVTLHEGAHVFVTALEFLTFNVKGKTCFAYVKAADRHNRDMPRTRLGSPDEKMEDRLVRLAEVADAVRQCRVLDKQLEDAHHKLRHIASERLDK